MPTSHLTPHLHQSFAIQIEQLTKNFKHWAQRPTSIKTMLIEALKGKFHFGVKHEFCVLKNITLEIKQGEFVGIMGANGAGKSTLLKLICGIYTPSSGKVKVHAPIAPLIELGAGFQGDLSGYENIFLNAAILGFGRKATLDALPNIIEFSELGEKIQMPIKNYSSGMLVRLGFSIAAHLTAPIILCDEVLAVGDAGFQAKCLRKITELHQEGRTIILITHTGEAVRNFCKRCIVISDQKVVFDGAAGEGVDTYLSLVTSRPGTTV